MSGFLAFIGAAVMFFLLPLTILYLTITLFKRSYLRTIIDYERNKKDYKEWLSKKIDSDY